MSVRFANTYIDRLFAEKDLDAIHHLISVVAKERTLPDEFWLFCRIYEWAPTRSGVWQYYEQLRDAEFNRIWEALNRFGLKQIADKYSEGKKNWRDRDHTRDLDNWLNIHAKEIHGRVFDLIAPRKDFLRHSD